MATLDKTQEDNSLLKEDYDKELILGHKNNILQFITSPRSNLWRLFTKLFHLYWKKKEKKQEQPDCGKHSVHPHTPNQDSTV